MNQQLKLLSFAILITFLNCFQDCSRKSNQQNLVTVDTSNIMIDHSPQQFPIDNMPNSLGGQLGIIPNATEMLRTDTDPEFPGGVSAMDSFFKKYLKKPKAARRAGVTGRVYVSFMVASDGQIGDVMLLKGIGFGCDEEAMRVVLLMPRWKPAMKDGEFVSTRYNLPILFD
jgi:protein TonB